MTGSIHQQSKQPVDENDMRIVVLSEPFKVKSRYSTDLETELGRERSFK